MAKAYRDRALLESAAARPFQTAFGVEIHPGLFAKGAALFHSLITNHPFGDGNKRTAVTALQLFLISNGVVLLASQAKMYNLAIDTASAGERAVPQDKLLETIEVAHSDDTITLGELHRTKGFRELYNRASQAKRHIRTHPLNKKS
jgi:death-on-curing family protein